LSAKQWVPHYCLIKPLPLATDKIITKTATLLKQGKIIAIKGIGGFHLACLADINSAVVTLRKRKHRKHKPVAESKAA
jgi:hydrogenase maturation protein HypF